MSIDLQSVTAADLSRMLSEPPQEPPRFSPPGTWNGGMLAKRSKIATDPYYVSKDWLPDSIEATPRLVSEPGRRPAQHEVELLLVYQRELRPARAIEIERQDRGVMGLMESLLEEEIRNLKGDVRLIRHLDRYFSRLQEEAKAVVVQQKLLFNRERPWQHILDFEAQICPGHSSYPSGHATEIYTLAFTWCDLLSQMNDSNDKLSKLRSEMLILAMRVAVNREIGGMHYPSDTLAGMQLARKVANEAVALITRTDDFKKFKGKMELLLR